MRENLAGVVLYGRIKQASTVGEGSGPCLKTRGTSVPVCVFQVGGKRGRLPCSRSYSSALEAVTKPVAAGLVPAWTDLKDAGSDLEMDPPGHKGPGYPLLCR